MEVDNGVTLRTSAARPTVAGASRRRGFCLLAGAVLWLTLETLRIAAASAYEIFPRTDFPVTDGLVNAVLETNGVVYLGGTFQRVMPARGQGALLDLETGLYEEDFPTANGGINAVTSDGAGGWIIGGSFSAVGGVPRRNLAHIRGDGSVNPHWSADVTGVAVYDLAVTRGRVIVGGWFTHVGGLPRMNVAVVELATGKVASWKLSADHYVENLAVLGNTLYLAGTFTQVNGTARDHLAAVDLDAGRLLPWKVTRLQPAYYQLIRDMAATCDGIYIAGSFTNIDDKPRDGLAALDPQSGAVSSWEASFDRSPEIIRILPLQGRVLVTGRFWKDGELRFAGLLDGSSGINLPWRPKFPGGEFVDMSVGATVIGNSLYASVSQWRGPDLGSLARLCEVDLTTGLSRLLPDQWSYFDFPLDSKGSRLFAGGRLARNAVIRAKLAALNQVTGEPLEWSPSFTQTEFISSLVFHDGQLLAGGVFGLAQVNPQSAERLNLLGLASPDPSYHPVISSMVRHGQVLYVGGDYVRIGTLARRNLAALDLSTGKVLDWNPSPNGGVNTLLVSSNALFVGGQFDTIAGESRRSIAMFELSSGKLLDWRPPKFPTTSPSATYSLGIQGATLYATGNYINVGSTDASFVDLPGPDYCFAWDLASDKLLPWKPMIAGGGAIVVPTPEMIYLGGTGFYLRGDYQYSDDDNFHVGLAGIDASTGRNLLWKPKLDYGGARAVFDLTSLITGRGGLYVAGNFDKVDLHPRAGFAVFPPVGWPRVVKEPGATAVAEGGPLELEVEAVGNAPLAFQWELNGAPLMEATQAVLRIPQTRVADSGLYRVSISNAVGFVRSQAVRVTVFIKPTIVLAPVSRVVEAGTTVQLTAGAVGTPTPRVQWRRNGVNIPGATQSVLLFSSVQALDGGVYTLLAENVGGVAESPPAALRVSLPEIEATDAFAMRPKLSGASGSISLHNRGASLEPGEPRHASKTGGSSVWLGWVAPADGVWLLDTRGSGMDTLLGVYSGERVDQLNVLGSDDDQGGYLTSAVGIAVKAGTAYAMALDGHGGQQGDIVLNWRLDTNVLERPRILIPPRDQVVVEGADAVFTVVAAGDEPWEYQWYYARCTAIAGATNATLRLSTVGPGDVGQYSVRISSRSGLLESPVASLELGVDPKSPSYDKFGDAVNAVLTPAALSRQSGSVTAVPGVRRLGGASVVAGVPGSQVLNNFLATTELGEPNHGGVIGGASRWLSLRCQSDGLLNVDTLGSDVDTVLAVYTGLRLEDLVLIASDNNGAPDGARSRVHFRVTRDTVYLVAVDSVDGASGQIQINWRLGQLPALAGSLNSQAVSRGGRVSLEVTPTGDPFPSLQWEKDGEAIPGATNSQYHIGNFALADTGEYRLVARNLFGVLNSTPAKLILAISEPLRLGLVNGPGESGLRLSLSGLSQARVRIERSADLTDWSLWMATNAATEVLEMPLPPASSSSAFFYRALLPR